MSLLQTLDLGLAALVLAVAGWTIAARQAFAAVVGFVVYGLLLSIVWVRLFAVDVALTEAAIGSGATGVLLIGAASRLREAEKAAADEEPSWLLRLLAGTLCAMVTAALAAVVLLLPAPAPTLAPEAAQDLAATGLGNPITAVLMAYRSFDTMVGRQRPYANDSQNQPATMRYPFGRLALSFSTAGASVRTAASGVAPEATSACTVNVGTRRRRQTSGYSCSNSKVATWLSGTVRPFGSGSCSARKVDSEIRCSSRARVTTLMR